MIRWIAVLLTGILTSFFLFPFNLPVGAEVNTKMALAVFGLAFFVSDMAKKRSFSVSKDFLTLSLICLSISVWALLSTSVNGSQEKSFVTYIISVWVWFGGAYAVIWLIRQIHGKLTVELIGRYMVAVCTAQCLLAYIMTLSPPLKDFIDSIMGESDQFMGVAEGRVYGLGAALDPSGLRFAGVLIILTHLISRTDFSTDVWPGLAYLASFFVISVIGSMMSRTTLVGTGLGITGLLMQPLWRNGLENPGAFWKVTAPFFLIGIGLCAWLYNINPEFRAHLRFGFEGFFSLVEKGRWETRSTNILKGMIVWPESVKTWIIGDGYFDNPQDVPDIIGRVASGYYKHTDIGYLRYIFYFGAIGLAGMIAVFVHMTATCGRRLKGYAALFVFLLLLNLIGWIKVSSDIIMVFAPFLIMAYTLDQNDNEETPSD